ncbi:MAG: AAA family ATPase [Candidatus Thalassarchaeaceae archaeon]|jgi:cell division control protein 6|nr:AAA family ATPase [Candidatus Thalassarchaeaceae archaeon]
MADYLKRIGAGLILLDATPLSYDWVPPEIVGRGKEQEALAAMFAAIGTPGISCRAVITGNVGCGKTVLSRAFGDDISRHLSAIRTITTVHVNCRNHPSIAQVLQRIAKTLDERWPDRGFSSSEVIQGIRRNLRTRNQHMLLILDEIDHLLRREGGDLLYQLLRIDEGRDESGTLSLILVSQEQVLDQLEGAIISRFGKSNHLALKPYTSEQLTAIASQRAELATRHGAVSESILTLIGQVAAESGDARVAIELLEASVKSAEMDGSREVEIQHVDQERKDSKLQTVEPSLVNELLEHEKLTLLAICRRLRRDPEITTGDAEKLYKVVCEEFSAKPRSHTTFWKNIKSLESRGLMVTRMATAKAGRGRTQYISMPDSLPGTLEKRLEQALNQ